MAHHVGNSEFAIHNRKEIVSILDNLVKSRTAINLNTQDGVGFPTSLLKISSEGNYVYLDISPDDRTNEKIRHSKHVTFSTQTGINVRWHSTHLHRVSLPDGDAFSMALPAVVERIQRREYFRLSTPQGSRALICKIPVDADTIDATIVDMSAGGVGVSIKGTRPASFSEGAQLSGCSIEFPGLGIVPIGLRICKVWGAIKTKSGEEVHRIGMEFLNLSRGASNVVQRHMFELEKEQIIKI
jgi:c-di-GMP-binding flagellar brake protein YcgR